MNKELIEVLEQLQKELDKKAKEEKELSAKAAYLDAEFMVGVAIINNLKKQLT